MLAPWKKRYDQPNFSSNHVLWEMDHKEGWAPNNWCFWIVVLEETPESPLDCKEITPVNPKGSQSWIFIGRGDAEAEAPILWPPEGKSWLIGKDAGTDWRQAKGATEDEMVGWHHRFNGDGSWWWTGKPGVLQSIGSQRVRHDLVTEQQILGLSQSLEDTWSPRRPHRKMVRLWEMQTKLRWEGLSPPANSFLHKSHNEAIGEPACEALGSENPSHRLLQAETRQCLLNVLCQALTRSDAPYVDEWMSEQMNGDAAAHFVSPDCLRPGLGKLFLKTPDGRYFGLCRLYGLCRNCSSALPG